MRPNVEGVNQVARLAQTKDSEMRTGRLEPYNLALQHILTKTTKSREASKRIISNRSIIRTVDKLFYDERLLGFFVEFRGFREEANLHDVDVADYKNGRSIAALCCEKNRGPSSVM